MRGLGLGLTIASALSSVAVATPTVTALSTTYGDAAGGTTVTVTGTNFVSGAVASFNGTNAASTTFVNSTTLTCVTAAGTKAANTDVVVTQGGQSGTLTGKWSYLPSFVQLLDGDIGNTTTWPDQSSHANDVTWNVAPSVAGTTLNGHRPFTLAAGAGKGTHPLALTIPYTTYVVGKYSGGTYGMYASWGVGAYPVYARWAGGTTWGLFGGAGFNDSTGTDTTAAIMGAVARATTDVDLRTRGVVHNVSIGSPPAAAHSNIGLDAGLGDQLVGDIFFVVAFTTALSSADAAIVESFLETRFAL